MPLPNLAGAIAPYLPKQDDDGNSGFASGDRSRGPNRSVLASPH